MNSLLKKIVVVISSSDVILSGFSEILKNSQAIEVVLVHRAGELVDFRELSGNILIVAPETEIETNGVLIGQLLSKASAIQYMIIDLLEKTTSQANAIKYSDTSAMICFKINERLNSFPSEPESDPETELTRRETEVLKLLCKGHSNKEIADQLFVSTHTVISHRKNISEKTGIKSASGLTMYAILKKIVDMSDINAADLI
jgi:DNA-binding CsgD family transcriptional regulator